MTQRTFAQHNACRTNLRPRIDVDFDLKQRFASRKTYLTRKPVKPLDREIVWAKARTEEAVTRYQMTNESHATLWLTYSFGVPVEIANMHIAMFGGVHPYGLTSLPTGQGNLSWLELCDPPKGDDEADEDTVPLGTHPDDEPYRVRPEMQ